MRILQTCFSRSWGGLEIQALDISQELLKRNHAVWLACCSGSRLEREAQENRIPVLTLAVKGYVHPGVVWHLARFIRRHDVAIIHCQLSKDIALAVPAARLSGRRPPVFLSKRVGSYIGKRDPLHRYTYSGIHRILAISSVIHANVLATTPIAPNRVVTLHDAIDTERFSPGRADGRSVREEFGIPGETTLIGFAGRFSPGKGHEEFLEAAAALSAERSGLAFLIVGEASYGEENYAEKIRRMSEELGLGRLLRFAGFRRDMPDVMAAFDIFAFPSHAESFGLVLIEAMAMERPVVSTNCDGVLDIMVDGETGLYVRPKRPGELAASLRRLVDDPELRRKMGKAGRERVVRLFDKRNQITRLEDLYAGALDGTARPAPP